MASTDPITSLPPGTQAATNAALGKSAGQLNVNDFMTLMTAQLKNQDPLNPLESTAFVAQLAQFGTVSGIQSMQSSLSTLSDTLRSSQVLNGTSLVGHDIMTPANSTLLGAIGSIQGSVTVPDGATSLSVSIKDASGQVVRTLTLPPASGSQPFTWDGNTDAGTRAASGAYTLTPAANVGGAGQSPELLLSGRVSSVTLNADNNSLTLNTDSLGSIALSKVRSVM